MEITELKKLEIFSKLNEEELNKIAKIARKEVVKKDKVIFREDTRAQNLYLITKGKVAIYMELHRGEEMVLRTLTDGMLFSWSALVPPYRLTASARAMEDSELIVIGGEELEALFEEDPRLGYLIMSAIAGIASSRLRDTRMQLASFIYG